MTTADRAQGSKISLVIGTLTFPKLEVVMDRSTQANLWREFWERVPSFP